MGKRAKRMVHLVNQMVKWSKFAFCWSQVAKPLLLVVHQVNVLAAVDGEDGRHEQDDDHDEVEEQPRRQEPAELRQGFGIISRLFRP